MSTIFWEISKRNIRLHMLRSSLAMLGIIIGVVAIASMGILGNSMVQAVSASLSSVGDSVIVMPYVGGGMGFGGGGGGSSANLMLTDQNYQQIKRVVAPNFATDHNVKVGSRISIGTDGQYGTLRVTGIIKERGMSFDISTDNAIVVTKDWFESTYNDQDQYNEVVVKVTSGDTADVKTTIENQLNRNIKQKTVTVIDSKATLATIYQTFGTITTFVTAIGGISMLVAGVSIFNIMMMSVNERIKEIGIMRSIGTQKKEVMSMFIYEAAIIGVAGSLIGGVLSLLGGYAISSLVPKTTQYLFTLS